MCFREFGIVPEGFIDNNRLLWGNSYEGIPIYAPDRLKKQENDYIAVTCKDEETICRQLLEMGIEENKILYGNHKIRNYLFYCAARNDKPEDYIRLKRMTGSCPGVVFDLQNGMVLGGVEAWTYELAGQLKKQGVGGVYLTTDNTLTGPVNKTYPAHIFRYTECTGQKEIIESGVSAIAENLPCTVICNFPQYIFWSACIAKRRYPEQVRIIAVQHSDDETYYEAYGLWQEYIDCCLVISSFIEDKLITYGMEKNKIMLVGWHVSCDEILDRSWSKEELPIQIGYAGRVTVTLKRADLLLEAALKLREKGIRFCLNIAGTGDYMETLLERIREEELSGYVRLAGYIDRKEIPDFWKKQDIMISCSEREGHSISQAEAMAAGAVPVITDVSGARDDVTDGYNGFVVPVNDLKVLVDRICVLYHNRGRTKQMGIYAHETIYKRQKAMNQKLFWEDLLRKVWL